MYSSGWKPSASFLRCRFVILWKEDHNWKFIWKHDSNCFQKHDSNCFQKHDSRWAITLVYEKLIRSSHSSRQYPQERRVHPCHRDPCLDLDCPRDHLDLIIDSIKRIWINSFKHATVVSLLWLILSCNDQPRLQMISIIKGITTTTEHVATASHFFNPSTAPRANLPSHFLYHSFVIFCDLGLNVTDRQTKQNRTVTLVQIFLFDRLFDKLHWKFAFAASQRDHRVICQGQREASRDTFRTEGMSAWHRDCVGFLLKTSLARFTVHLASFSWRNKLAGLCQLWIPSFGKLADCS